MWDTPLIEIATSTSSQGWKASTSNSTSKANIEFKFYNIKYIVLNQVFIITIKRSKPNITTRNWSWFFAGWTKHSCIYANKITLTKNYPEKKLIATQFSVFTMLIHQIDDADISFIFVIFLVFSSRDRRSIVLQQASSHPGAIVAKY